MTIGNKSGLIALLLGCSISAASADQAAFDSVMNSLARVESNKSSYVEKKFISFLDSTVVQKGTLIYRAPDQLTRELHYPVRELFDVKGNELTIERKQKRRVIDLQAAPPIQAFVESFRATLSGDVSKLRKYYKPEFSGTLLNWNILLTPKSKQMSRYIKSIRIKGSSGNINFVEIQEQDGDRSEMVLTEVSRKSRED